MRPAAPRRFRQVLGYYNSGASLLSRLLMLMGVFAGHGEQLRIGAWRVPVGTVAAASCAGVVNSTQQHELLRPRAVVLLLLQTRPTSCAGGS